MNFSSVQLAEIEGLLDVNRDFCRFEMQQLCFGKAEHNQPALESEGFARRCRNLRTSAMVSVRVAKRHRVARRRIVRCCLNQKLGGVDTHSTLQGVFPAFTSLCAAVGRK